MSSTKCGMVTPHFRFLATKLLFEQEVHNQPGMRCLLARYLLGTRYTTPNQKSFVSGNMEKKIAVGCELYFLQFLFKNTTISVFEILLQT